MKKIAVLFFGLILSFRNTAQETDMNAFLSFTPTQKEIGCMKYFNPKSTNIDPFNNYILAKMNEAMYTERLDYMYRFFQNGRKPVDSIPSTHWLKKNPILIDDHFEEAFEKRFKHMFNPSDSVRFKFLHLVKYITGPFGLKTKLGYDPELIVISTTTYTILVYRGTDIMEDNIRGEWIGTDFRAWKTGKSPLYPVGRVHKGFSECIELIQPYLEDYLKEINAIDKPIWVTGHSLGGAMAILSSYELEKKGFNVPIIYVYGTPNSIGNKKMIESMGNTFLDKINRFEFYLDPFPMLWTPGYYSFGHRNWIMPDWSMMVDVPPRYFGARRTKCPNCDEKQEENLKYAFEKNFFSLPVEIYHHNPQWYTKALVHYLPSEEKQNCPDIDDSFPYIYYGWEEAK